MALIKCSECGHEISDKAEACPHCGCPVEKQPVEEKATISDNKTNVNHSIESNQDFTEKSKTIYAEHKVFIIVSACIFLFVILLSMCTGAKTPSYTNTPIYYENTSGYKEMADSAEQSEEYFESSSFIGKYTFSDDRQKWTLEIKPDNTCILTNSKGRERYGSWNDFTETLGYYHFDFTNEFTILGDDNAEFVIGGKKYDVIGPAIDANIEWIYEYSASCEAKHPKKRLKLTRIGDDKSKH